MECCTCKIFAGNVPFDCSENEFAECFKNMEGFVKAEIIYKNDSMTKISRGFGFITFETPEYAKILLDKNCIIFKNRKLRFTQYVTDIENSKSFLSYKKKCDTFQSNINKQLISPKIYIKNQYTFNNNYVKNGNFLLVRNISENMTRDELYDIFSKFSNIGKYFIVTDQDTGNTKSYAIVEILNNIIYDLLLEQREIKHNSLDLKISKWKIKSPNTEKKYVINKK